MDITFRQLKHFEAVYRLCSFVQAADDQQVTQSALTKSLRSLEDSLGNRLFDRSTRSVQPTELGERLIKHALKVLGQVEALNEEAMHYSGRKVGRIALGAGPYPTYPVMTGAIQKFAEVNPGICVSLETGSSQKLLDDLVNRKLDIVVCDASKYERTIHYDNMAVTPLEGDEIVVVHKSEDGRFETPQGAAKALRELRFAFPKSSPHFLRQMNSHQRSAEARGEYPHYECDSTSACIQLARAGGVVAIVPKGCALEAEQSGDLSWSSLPKPLRTNDAVHYLKDRTMGPSVNQLIDLIRVEAMEIARR